MDFLDFTTVIKNYKGTNVAEGVRTVKVLTT